MKYCRYVDLNDGVCFMGSEQGGDPCSKDMENICPWALHGRIEKLENDLNWANKKMQLYEMQIEQDKDRILELEKELKEE